MSFTEFMGVIVQVFGVLYTTGTLLISWLATPLSDSLDAEFVELLGDLASFTPFELMFGAGLFFALMAALIKFFTSIF